MNISISEFLNRFDDIMAQDSQIVEAYGTSKLDFHFRPQVFHFGQDKNYFSHVFTVNQISTGLKDLLENHWQLKLPDIHARNSQEPYKSVNLSKEDEAKIRNLYAVDYQSGWGSQTW